jgi:hypothetical protein
VSLPISQLKGTVTHIIGDEMEAVVDVLWDQVRPSCTSDEECVQRTLKLCVQVAIGNLERAVKRQEISDEQATLRRSLLLSINNNAQTEIDLLARVNTRGVTLGKMSAASILPAPYPGYPDPSDPWYAGGLGPRSFCR